MAVGNTGSRIVGNTEFYGGLSTDDKIGIENSYADGECLDVRKSPSQMTVLPMSRKLPDGDVITGLMTAMTQSKDGDIWGIDEGGKLYEIDANSSVTVVGTDAESSGFSLEYSDIDDALWAADGGHKLLSYGKIMNPMGTTRTSNVFEYLDDNSEYIMNAIHIQYGTGAQYYYQSNANIVRANGDKTCSVGTSVDETIVAGTELTSRLRQYAGLFLPACTPIVQVGIRFMAKGTGTVQLIIHDEQDNVVASSVAMDAADVSTSGYTMFNVRPNPTTAAGPANQLCPVPWAGDTIEAGSVYHIHIVASTSGYTVKTSTANDMSLTLDLSAKAYVLHDTYNGKHPMTMFDKLYIGNGRYVATKGPSPINLVNDTILIQDALRLDDGFEVCCFGSSDEYLMIGAEKYNARADRGFQAGRIYFWDRQTEAPNFYVDCTMGAPKAIFNLGNIVYIIIAGALYAYTGGKELVKVRTLKGTDTEYTGQTSITEVNPNMMAVRREVLAIGFPSKTTAYTIRHGIYAFGSVDKNYPNCFTYNYKIPGETVQDTLEQYNSDTQKLRIGCVYNFNDTLFYSYEVKAKVTPEPIDPSYTGKNLVYTKPTMDGGIKFDYNMNTGLTTITGQQNYSFSLSEKVQTEIPAGTYTLSINEPQTVVVGIGAYDAQGNRTAYEIPVGETSTTFTTNYTIVEYETIVAALSTGTSYNIQVEIQLETGSTPTAFEPYIGVIDTKDTALAVVDNQSGTSTSYIWKSLQYDAGAPYLEKMALRIGIFFDPLPANTTITPIYRIDDGPWVAVNEAKAVAGDRLCHCDINKRFHELQYGFIGTTGNDTLTPVIKQVSAGIRVLDEEQKL